MTQRERGVEVRDLAFGDHDVVKQLHQRCFPEEMALEDLVLDNLFAHPYGINLVAEIGDEIAGYAGAIHGARLKARLLTIHTAPEARRSGVASALLDALEERLVARKAKTLELEVHVDNDAARRLYASRGFEVVREDPATYPNAEPSAGYVMQQSLEPDAPGQD